MLRTILDWLWGYDFFISYAHADGSLIEAGKRRSRYVTSLVDQLRKSQFSVFHDESEYDPGIELNAATVRRVRSSTKLLVVARPAAMTSEWVLKEVMEAIRACNDVVVVDVNDTYKRAAADNLLRQAIGDSRLRFAETLADPDGEPSPMLVEKLYSASQRSRRDRRRQRAITAAALMLALFAGLATWQWWRAEVRRLISEGQQYFAEAESAFAEARRMSLVRDEQILRLRKLTALPKRAGTQVLQEEIDQYSSALQAAKSVVVEKKAAGVDALRRAKSICGALEQRGYTNLKTLSSAIKPPSVFSIEMLRGESGGESTLVVYGDIDQPHFVLIDGGGSHSSSFRNCIYPRLRELADAWEIDGALRLELVIGCQWDIQRIGGIYGMLKSLMDSTNTTYLPLNIKTLWFNVYPRGISGTSRGGIAAKYEIAVLAKRNGIPLNQPFDVHVSRPDDGTVSVELTGGLKVSVLNPSTSALNNFWKYTYRSNDDSAEGKPPVPNEEFRSAQLVVQRSLKSSTTNYSNGLSRGDHSVVNQASMVLLFEFENKSFLYCGDANDSQIVDGLHLHGRLNENGEMQVDVLHIPHGGSDLNVSETFFRTIKAVHYLITGDGTHGNPEPETLDMIVGARSDERTTWHFAHRDSADSLGEALDAYFAVRQLPNVTRVFREVDDVSTRVHLLEHFAY